MNKITSSYRLDLFWLWIAQRLPGRLRMLVVVDSANIAFGHEEERGSGYAGPGELGFDHLYFGALRRRPGR